MARRNLSFRAVTHVAQNIENDADIVDGFVSAVRRICWREMFNPDQIVNMDETNIQFDEPARRTINVRGARSIPIQTTGSSGSVTVALAVTLTGRKLRPFIIFKGAPHGRIVREFQSFPDGAYYCCQRRNWMDVDTMYQWIDHIWKREIDGNSPSYLLWDHFSVHRNPEIISSLELHGTQVDLVPAGYTSTLQVLDVGINRPFKTRIREQYRNFMEVNEGARATRHHVAEWIINAWNSLSIEGTVNTWARIFGEDFINQSL